MTPNVIVAHHPGLCHTLYDAQPLRSSVALQTDGSKREGCEML